jgi:hypothetical protein
MITKAEARTIAAGWISPSPYDKNLTAFATGSRRWSVDGLASEVQRNIIEVRRSPKHYDDSDQSLKELRDLREWVETQAQELSD